MLNLLVLSAYLATAFRYSSRKIKDGCQLVIQPTDPESTPLRYWIGESIAIAAATTLVLTLPPRAPLIFASLVLGFLICKSVIVLYLLARKRLFAR